MEPGKNSTAMVEPDPSVVTMAHVVYGLHALSLLIGIFGAVTIIGAFVFGIPSIVAVILNYVHQPKALGTYVASHFRWQIRSFWFALLWVLLAVVLLITIVGIPLAWLMFIGAGIWVIYRVARGWLTLHEHKPIVF